MKPYHIHIFKMCFHATRSLAGYEEVHRFSKTFCNVIYYMYVLSLHIGSTDFMMICLHMTDQLYTSTHLQMCTG